MERCKDSATGLTAGPNQSAVCQCLELVRRHGLCPCVRFRGRVRLQWDALRLGAAIDCFSCLRVCPAPTCASPSHTQGCHLPARALPMPPGLTDGGVTHALPDVNSSLSHSISISFSLARFLSLSLARFLSLSLARFSLSLSLIHTQTCWVRSY